MGEVCRAVPALTASPSSCCAAALRLPQAGAPPPAPPAPSLRSAVGVGFASYLRSRAFASLGGWGRVRQLPPVRLRLRFARRLRRVRLLLAGWCV